MELSDEERHKRYLYYLDIFKELGVDVEDPYPGILLDFDFSKEKEIRLDLNTVRNMGMEIDPFFLLELRVNGIIPEFIFRPAKKGEITERKNVDKPPKTGYIKLIKYIKEENIIKTDND